MNKAALPFAAALLALSASAGAAVQAVMHKDPYCGCCDMHAEHLRKAGIPITVKPRQDMAAFKAAKGVAPALQSCHTIEVGGYIVEGHVPASAVKKLLAQKPKIKGISVPGMPGNSPGMAPAGAPASTLKVYTIAAKPQVFSVEKVGG